MMHLIIRRYHGVGGPGRTRTFDVSHVPDLQSGAFAAGLPTHIIAELTAGIGTGDLHETRTHSFCLERAASKPIRRAGHIFSSYAAGSQFLIIKSSKLTFKIDAKITRLSTVGKFCPDNHL